MKYEVQESTISNEEQVENLEELSNQFPKLKNKIGRTMKKERLTVDKLPGIRADLTRLDDNCQEWDFIWYSLGWDPLRRWTDSQ